MTTASDRGLDEARLLLDAAHSQAERARVLHRAAAACAGLPARLRTFREARGMTGAEVARWLNVQPSSYYDYEAGLARPKLHKLLVLAHVLGVSTDELLGCQRAVATEAEDDR